MSAEEFRKGISRFRDVQDGPNLRKRVYELEEIIRTKDSQIEKNNLNHEKEINRFQDTILKQENLIHGLEASNDEFESIRISVGGKEKVSLKKFARLVTAEAKKENQETIISRANAIAKNKIPHYVMAEISKYPDNCNDETWRNIESRVLIRRDEYLNDPNMWSSEFQTWINEHIETMVNQKMDEVFWTQVHLEANTEINQRLPAKWRYQLENYATNYMQSSFQDQLRRLAIPLTLTCPKCIGSNQITLTPNDMARMIKKGSVSYPCIYCKGRFKPRIFITLGELFWLIVNGDVTPQKIPEHIEILQVRVVDQNTEARAFIH